MSTVHPFNQEEELKDVGMYAAIPKPYGMPGAAIRKFNTPITPKENFLRICRKERPVWMPNMSVDFNLIQPEIMADANARNHGGIDWFGIEWEFEPKSNAAMVKPGTRRLSGIIRWEEELVFPDLKAIDWAKDYKEHYSQMDPDRATMFVIVNGCFERLADLTSFEDTFCYLLEEEEAVEGLFSRLTDFHIELMEIAKKYYHADIITFHDDMGTQISSFMSPDTFREVMLPHYIRMNEAAHKMGLYVNYHSCGCVGNQIENFCDAGFDFWEGQDNCNNKTEILEKFGERLGQISVFMPSPELDDEEFEKYIENQIYTMGKEGRYIPWYVNAKPDRKVDGAQLIYTLSRKLYSV